MPGMVLSTLTPCPVLTATPGIRITVSIYQKNLTTAKIYRGSKWRRWGSSSGLALSQACGLFCTSFFRGWGEGGREPRLYPEIPNVITNECKEAGKGRSLSTLWKWYGWQLYEVSAHRQGRCYAEWQNQDCQDLSGLEWGIESNTVIFNKFSTCKTWPWGTKC